MRVGDAMGVSAAMTTMPRRVSVAATTGATRTAEWAPNAQIAQTGATAEPFSGIREWL